jgi:glycosyltransferase involved in cell wall biosynthesis
MTAASRPTPHSAARLWAEERSLLVFDDKIYFHNGRSYSCSEAHALFEMELGRYFKSVTLCGRLKVEPFEGAYSVARGNVRVSGIPFYPGVADLMLRPFRHAPAAWATLRHEVDCHDVIWLAWPHPLSLAVITHLRARRKATPYFLVVREDMPEMVKRRYQGLSGLAAVLAAKAIVGCGSRLARDPVVFAVGDVMVARYSERFARVHPIVFPLLRASDVERTPRRRPQGGALRLLAVGRLEPEKGFDLLVRAVRLLVRRGERVVLDLAGTGAEENRLKVLARELRVDDLVTFRGYVPNGNALSDLYRRADVFVLPSLTEAVPSVLFEAAAFGLPVVATRVGGVPAHVRDGETGLLVEPGSVHALAGAVAALACDRGRRAEMGRRARALGRESTMEREHEALLETLASSFAGDR